MSFEAIAIIFAILIWIISGIVKGFKWLGTQLRGTNALPDPARAAVPQTPQMLPQRVPPLLRQPSRPETVPGPVRLKPSTAEFISQEQALRAEEASGLGVPLTAPALPLPTQAAPLFGTVDDLVRAIILQEVLGPPLSRRTSPPAPPPV